MRWAAGSSCGVLPSVSTFRAGRRSSSLLQSKFDVASERQHNNQQNGGECQETAAHNRRDSPFTRHNHADFCTHSTPCYHWHKVSCSNTCFNRIQTLSYPSGSILSVESNLNVESKTKNVDSKVEKMWSQKQYLYLYTSRNSLFWALTHLIQYNLYSSSFQNPDIVAIRGLYYFSMRYISHIDNWSMTPLLIYWNYHLHRFTSITSLLKLHHLDCHLSDPRVNLWQSYKIGYDSVSEESVYCFCTKFSQLILSKIIKIVANFKAKMHQNQFRLGHRLRPHYGSLQRSHRPPSWI